MSDETKTAAPVKADAKAAAETKTAAPVKAPAPALPPAVVIKPHDRATAGMKRYRIRSDVPASGVKYILAASKDSAEALYLKQAGIEPGKERYIEAIDEDGKQVTRIVRDHVKLVTKELPD